MASSTIEQTVTTPTIRISGVGNRSLSGRRLSIPDSTNEVFLDDDPSEDWTRTTAEKDSWAHQERRRSSMWQKIDNYPALYSPESSPRSRRGSILGLFTHGKDKDGNDVLYSGDGDPEDWNGKHRIDGEQPSVTESPNQAPAPVQPEGIPMPWIRGKDNQGRAVTLWIQYE